MLLSSRQHCPGTLFCDTTILVINEGNSTQLCSFGGQGHLGGLTASGTAGTWPKARALLATTVRAALWYHETSPLTLSFFLNSKMKPYATNQVEPGLAEALRLMAAVCHQLTANRRWGCSHHLLRESTTLCAVDGHLLGNVLPTQTKTGMDLFTSVPNWSPAEQKQSFSHFRKNLTLCSGDVDSVSQF